MTPEYRVALLRGIGLSFISAGVVFFAILPTTDDWKTLAAGTGGAFFSALAWRFGIEGAIDSATSE